MGCGPTKEFSPADKEVATKVFHIFNSAVPDKSKKKPCAADSKLMFDRIVDTFNLSMDGLEYLLISVRRIYHHGELSYYNSSIIINECKKRLKQIKNNSTVTDSKTADFHG